MKEEVKTIYRCDHCKKPYFLKRFAIKHEESCAYNPNNKRDCFECAHLCKKERNTFIGENYLGGEEFRSLNLLYCGKKEIYLHTPQSEIKENAFDLGDEANNVMPINCEDLHRDIFEP